MKLIDEVINPYLVRKRAELKLPETQNAVAFGMSSKDKLVH